MNYRFYNDSMKNYLVIACNDRLTSESGADPAQRQEAADGKIQEQREFYQKPDLPKSGKKDTEIGYQYQMISTNHIDGLLPCSLRRINGDLLLYIDITSLQSMDSLFGSRRISADMLKKVLYSLADTGESIAHYLLDCRRLLIDPHFIYYSYAKDAWYFIYYPKEAQAGYHALFQFLADNTSPVDRAAAGMIYQLCDMADNQNFVLNRRVLDGMYASCEADSGMGQRQENGQGSDFDRYGMSENAGMPGNSDMMRTAGMPGSSDMMRSAGMPGNSDMMRSAGTPGNSDVMRNAGMPEGSDMSENVSRLRNADMQGIARDQQNPGMADNIRETRENDREGMMNSGESEREFFSRNGGFAARESSRQDYYRTRREGTETGREYVGTGREYVGTGREYVGTGREYVGTGRGYDGTGREYGGIGREPVGTGRKSTGIGHEEMRQSRENFSYGSAQQEGGASGSSGRDRYGRASQEENAYSSRATKNYNGVRHQEGDRAFSRNEYMAMTAGDDSEESMNASAALQKQLSKTLILAFACLAGAAVAEFLRVRFQLQGTADLIVRAILAACVVGCVLMTAYGVYLAWRRKKQEQLSDGAGPLMQQTLDFRGSQFSGGIRTKMMHNNPPEMTTEQESFYPDYYSAPPRGQAQ